MVFEKCAQQVYNKNMKKRTHGFTIVEIVIIISVIGILATVSYIGYGNWKMTTATTQVKSYLGGAASSMENSRNFANGYPATVPSTISENSDVVITGGSIDGGKSYCLDAASSQFTGLDYHVDSSSSKVAEPGKCPSTNSAVLNIIIDGPNSGKVLIMDGLFADECVKTDTSSDPTTCRFNYLYTSSTGKKLTGITAIPDHAEDQAGIKWYDYWQCIINDGAAIQPGAYTAIFDSTYHVNFGSHIYNVYPSDHNCESY